MAAIPNTQDPIQQTIDEIQKGERRSPDIKQMYGLDTSYSTSNRWIGYFPIQNVLGKKYNDLEINLVRFSIPQMNMGSTTVAFKGYQYEFPTKVLDPETKELTLEYIIDAKWTNYKALYAWISNIEGNINPVDTDSEVNGISTSNFIECKIWLIDQFKNRIIDFVFHNCWIKHFGDLALEAANTNVVTHNFTMAYSNFEIANANV